MQQHTGSLVIFRVHSAITDDAQSLVEFITILLSEGTFQDKKSKKEAAAAAAAAATAAAEMSQVPSGSGYCKTGETSELHPKLIMC